MSEPDNQARAEASGPVLFTAHKATCAALTKPFIEDWPCDCGLDRERLHAALARIRELEEQATYNKLAYADLERRKGLVEEKVRELEAEAEGFRAIVFAAHPCAGKYGDDGEMQCNDAGCMLDFKRDSHQRIWTKMRERLVRSNPPTTEGSAATPEDIRSGNIQTPGPLLTPAPQEKAGHPAEGGRYGPSEDPAPDGEEGQ